MALNADARPAPSLTLLRPHGPKPITLGRAVKFIDSWKIATKILVALILLASAFAASATYSSIALKKADTATKALVAHRAPAALELARVGRLVNVIGYAAYRVLAEDGSTAAAHQAKADIDAAAVQLRKNLKTAEHLLPENAATYRAFEAQASQIAGLADQAADLALAGQDDEAKRMMAQLDPKIMGMTKDIVSFNTQAAARDDKAVADLGLAAHKSIAVNIILAVGGIAIGVGFGLWVAVGKISRPLNRLSERMRQLAEGDLEVVVEAQDRGDEIGGMASAVQVFKENGAKAKALEAETERLRSAAEEERRVGEATRAVAAREQATAIERIGAGLSKLSGGDLTYRLTEAFAADYAKLREDFNATVETLQATMEEISGNSQGIRSGAGEITVASDDLSRRTEQQAASLEETAAALEEITATVKRTAEGATHASTVVAAAKRDAETGGEVVGKAIVAMNAIETSSQGITQIIGVIDEIAFQTNLLALNAGVEAARAGDAGRGFAVVAQEVRALAQRSAEAAKEIKVLIATSTTQVSAGVDLVAQTGKALERIVAQVAQINSVVGEIAASAQEQSGGLQQVNVAINQMDQVTQQNAAMVEESTAASHALAREAQDLARLIGRFKVDGSSARVAPSQNDRPTSYPVRAA
jgi:methyl-accepting chemotaxis protein